MSDSRRQGDIVLISIAVLVLFVVANLMADPAAGSVHAASDSESVVDAHEVRIYARSPNMSFTDLGIDTP